MDSKAASLSRSICQILTSHNSAPDIQESAQLLNRYRVALDEEAVKGLAAIRRLKAGGAEHLVDFSDQDIHMVCLKRTNEFELMLANIGQKRNEGDGVKLANNENGSNPRNNRSGMSAVRKKVVEVLQPVTKRFLVALSFPGEKRAFVESVANSLADVIGKEKVLYDRYIQAELARPNLDLYLGRLYHDESELIVPFFCADYERKDWCGLEWRQVRDLLKKRSDEQIMLCRFDDTAISGVLSIDGYLSVQEHSPRQVADAILERLARAPVNGRQRSYSSAAAGKDQLSALQDRDTLTCLRQNTSVATRKILTRIWSEYLETGDWPEVISIHGVLGKAKVTRLLDPLDRFYVHKFNSNLHGKKVYELGLLGILCTARGTKYLGLLNRYLGFLRDLHYGGTRTPFIDFPTLLTALELSPEEGKELGRVIQSGFIFAGGSTGNAPDKWTFNFPDDVDDLPRKKSVRPWVEKFVLKHCRPPRWRELGMPYPSATK